MELPRSTTSQYQVQAQVAAATAATVRSLVFRMGPDFDAGWRKVRGQVRLVADAGRLQTVNLALPYISAVLAETGQASDPVGSLVAARFIENAPDGRDFGSLLDETPIRAKVAVASGASATEAVSKAASWLSGTMLTVLADTRREVFSADIIRNRAVTGYVRMLNPPSCGRCVILAGKWFRWNQGFQRHPRCDCIHIPASEDRADDFTTDPYAYFNSLSEAEQNRLFGSGQIGRSNARAIRDGADIYRVENVRLRGLATAKGAARYGAPSRMTVDNIYRVAGTRKNAIQMLEREGYITGQQKAGGNIVGKRVERFAGMDRGKGFVTIDGRQVKTARASVVDARESGVRDPLNRATMTAAERRLYDAHYKLNYALTNGRVARSVGASSADYSTVESLATQADIDRLRAAYEKQLEIARDPRRSPASVRELAALLQSK